MKRRKRRIGGALLVILAILIMQLPVGSAEAAASEDFVMEGMDLAFYRGTDTVVSIPSGVEAIGGGAFENNRTLEKVIFPGSLKRIGAYAFWGCDSLKDVSFGKGLKEISDYAFTECGGLTSLQIPSTITSIGIQAFADCSNLTDITIPSTVTFIHETAFDGCSKLVIHCQEGSYASRYARSFYKRQQEFPEYEDVDIFEPTTGEELPEDSREDTISDTQDWNLLGSTSVVGNQAVVFINNQKPTVYQGVIAAKPEEKEEREPLKYRMVDDLIIADQAYYKDAELREIILPQGIREVGEFAFARCRAVRLSIAPGCEKIAYGAFYHSDALAQVVLPDSILLVEPKAFEHTAWVERFLQGETESGDYLISGGVLIAYRGEGITAEIPAGVRVIAAECFQGHIELEQVILPEGLLVIGEAAFEGCSGLQEVVWNKEVQKIADRAFRGCRLAKAELPDSLIYLGIGAFDSQTEPVFSGKQPIISYETSAQRLSAAAYRRGTAAWQMELQGNQTSEAEDNQADADNCFMVLSGAAEEYRLTIQRTDKEATREKAEKAFFRNLQEELPEQALLYELYFTDDTGIPIQKLGKQVLTVSMKVPDGYEGRELQLFQYDRNGQLDRLAVTYLKSDEVSYIRWETSRVYDVILLPTDKRIAEDEVLTVSKEVFAGSRQPVSEGQQTVSEKKASDISLLMILKWSLGGSLLLGGLVLALSKIR